MLNNGVVEKRLKLTQGLLLFLAAIGALGSMAIHMFVPTMPKVASDLAVPQETIQLAVTLYLIGMGLGQLVAGPISDSVGRRPVLLGGLCLFTIGAFGCTLAQTGSILLASRLLQAFGAAAGIVTVRAIVADLTERHEAAARMATLMTVLLISPAISPMVGGAIAALGGWRMIFLLLAIAGSVAAVICFLRISETAVVSAPGQQAKLAQGYLQLVRNIRFLRFAAGIACSSCALYIFLSASAFLLVDRYGLGTEEAGLCYFIVAGASIGGTFLVGRLEKRGGAFRAGLLSTGFGGALLIGLILAGFDNPVALIIPMAFVGMGGGIAGPAGIAGAMHAEPGMAGSGASLAGALQMIASGVTTSVIVHIHLDTPIGMAIGIFGAGLIGLMLAPRGSAT